jgi:hypothetical protein
MKRERLLAVGMLVCVGVLGCNSGKQEQVGSSQAEPVELTIVEGYPLEVIQALTDRQNEINQANRSINSMATQSVIAISKIRDTHRITTVAFKGGSVDLRQRIAATVNDWTNQTSLKLDFGGSADSNTFREWSTSDNSYAADIRISFDQPGYWSVVGTDGTDTSIAKPKQASMNFAHFDQKLPNDWRGIVLHEFGHALGFEHEHQSPVAPCEKEFRWEDDPGYVKTKDIYGQFTRDAQNRWPGIYTLLEGFPNNWKKEQIDFNLRRLPDSVDWRLSDFDKASIMKYYFDAVFFKNGKNSGCYSEENVVLSDQDKKAVDETYPVNPADAQRVLDAQLKANRELLSLHGLPASLKLEFSSKINSLSKHR